MESWLNYLFDGDHKTVFCKVGHFQSGLEARVTGLEKEYSVYVGEEQFRSADETLVELHKLEEQAKALKTDRRFKDLVAQIKREDAERQARAISEALREALVNS